MTEIHNVLRIIWQYLRELSGENDYARYQARALGQQAKPMPPGEFYVWQVSRKYSRISRCC